MPLHPDAVVPLKPAAPGPQRLPATTPPGSRRGRECGHWGPTLLPPGWRRCRRGRRPFPSRCGRTRGRSGGQGTGVGARNGSTGSCCRERGAGVTGPGSPLTCASQASTFFGV